MNHLFKAIDPSEVLADPFPHVILEGVSEPSLAAELVRDFPALATFTRGEQYPENFKILRRYESLRQDNSLPPSWRDFVRQHADLQLHVELERILGTHIVERYPDFNRRFGPLSQMRMGMRGGVGADNYPILLDVELVAHTPSPERSLAERGAHSKNSNKLAELHYYLGGGEDCELILYQVGNSKSIRFGARNQVVEGELLVAKRLPCRSNSGILFMCSPESITSITPRKSNQPLQYLVIVFELNENLFNLPGVGE